MTARERVIEHLSNVGSDSLNGIIKSVGVSPASARRAVDNLLREGVLVDTREPLGSGDYYTRRIALAKTTAA